MVLKECGDDPTMLAKVLAGIRAFQEARRIERQQDQPVAAQQGRVRLLDYGTVGRPVVIVPSLINPPYVLDLVSDNSLLRWLAQRDIRPLLLDWGNPREEDADLSIAGHVEELLLPLVGTIGEDAALAGYCLGGTMAIAAAARTKIAGLMLIAAPWDFAQYPQDSRDQFRSMWQAGKSATEALGLFPMELLQLIFWQLDPARTIAKYAAFGELEPMSAEADAFVLLEDWANEGPPLTLAAARELIEDFFGENLPGEGRWKVAGSPVDIGAIRCPVLNIRSSTDRVVPQATAAALGEDLVLDQGHVGMLVGRRAEALLWTQAAHWLSHLQ